MELYSKKSLRAISACGEYLFPNDDDNRACNNIVGFTVNQRHTFSICHSGDRVQTRLRRLSTLQDR